MRFSSAFVIAIANCVSKVHAGEWEDYSSEVSTILSSTTETDDCDSSTKTTIPSTTLETSTIYSTSTESDDCDSSTKTTIPSTTFETSTIYSTSTESDDCDSSTKTIIPSPTSYSNLTSTYFSTLTSTIPCHSCESETTSYTQITYTTTFVTTEPCESGSTSYVTLTSTFVTSEPWETTSEYVTSTVAPYENKTTIPETIIPETVTPETVIPKTVTPETATPETVFPETTVIPPYSNNTATTATTVTNVESSTLYTITPTPATEIFGSTTEGGNTVSLSTYVGEAVGKFTAGSSFAALIVMGAFLL